MNIFQLFTFLDNYIKALVLELEDMRKKQDELQARIDEIEKKLDQY